MSTHSVEVSQRRHLTTRQQFQQPPKLPVVNVIPFLSERQNTWVKDKSLPEFYEKPDVVLSSTEACMKPPPTALSTYSDSNLIVNEHRPILPLAQSNKPNIYDDTASVSSSQSEGKLKKYLTPYSPRVECISPERAIKQIPKHGFAPTIGDREKKTVKDSPQIKPTSLLNREKTEEFISRQQVMRLKGRRMMERGLQPANSLQFQRTNAMVPMRSLDDFYRLSSYSDPPSYFCMENKQLVNSYNRGYAFSPTKSRISRYPDPMVTQSNPELSSPRPRNPLVALNNENLSDKLDSYKDMSESKSAFRVLNSSGKPTPVEQNLARGYTQFLDSNKQNLPSNSNQHFTRYLKLKNYNPTQGEIFLMVNREQNKPGNWISSNLTRIDRSRYSDCKPQENWYFAVEERDIQVSLDTQSNMAALEPTQEQTIPKHELTVDLPIESQLNLTADGSENLSNAEDEEVSPPNNQSVHPNDDRADSSNSLDRIEIKTVLPDIHTPTLS